jgi:hypothetical protein
VSGSGCTLLSAGGTFGPDATVPVDLFFDAYVELAFEAARWLQEVHGGPPLEEAPGILGTLWRARGPDDTTAGGERR